MPFTTIVMIVYSIKMKNIYNINENSIFLCLLNFEVQSRLYLESYFKESFKRNIFKKK